jgi:hypothetical protein
MRRTRPSGGTRTTEALEITTFRLVAGMSCEDFVAANADVDAWLRRQPGFRSRRIAERDDLVRVHHRRGVSDETFGASRLPGTSPAAFLA